MNCYDAIILGGGPAGSATAFFLAQAGWKVAIVEKASFPRRKVCGEFLSATSSPWLDAMGIGDTWFESAGPSISRVGFFAQNSALSAPMPHAEGFCGWGRAYSRASLDLLLIERAREMGVAIWQPWKAISLDFDEREHRCTVQSDDRIEKLSSGVMVAAHGSWETGKLSTQLKSRKSSSDLLAFKLLFEGAKIDDELMPLIAFPGGYGGIAHIESGLVGLSCCIRRDVLQECRQRYGTSTAAAAVLKHICATTSAVAEALAHSIEARPSLAAGPIRPGTRPRYKDHIFRVGNAAGEAHPVIAEGISMALQGGGILAKTLISGGQSLDGIGEEYSDLWSAQFRPRIVAANLIAHMAMSTMGASFMVAAIKRIPKLLTVGANLSGKTKQTNKLMPSQLATGEF